MTVETVEPPEDFCISKVKKKILWSEFYDAKVFLEDMLKSVLTTLPKKVRAMACELYVGVRSQI